MMPEMKVFYGTFVHLPQNKCGDKHELSINRGALWVSSSTGKIQGFDWGVSSEEDLQSLIKRQKWVGDVEIVRAREDRNEFFFPGFVDTHIHAPQYPNSGLFGSSTLLDWLSTYTFPLESSFASHPAKPDLPPPQARSVYDRVISRTLAHGTTCASYFATIHVPATNLLATLCKERGQRALIGRVCMDNPSFCPDYYLDSSPETSVSHTRETITHIHALDPTSTLIKPIITPRFAPTCSRPALASLGQLAASYTPPLHIQTHISENTDEVSLVQSLFPECSSYTDVYDKHALLTPRTILAHGVHLTDAEHKLIHDRGAKISHCPASNSALGSGLCPVRKILNAGITVGLGTDVSGGYSASILEAVRGACLVSRLIASQPIAATEEGKSDTNLKDKDAVLSVEEALYLATRGGAAVVDMADEIGGFDQGMYFDAQLIRLGVVDETESCVDIFGWESWTEKIHKWVWNGDDRNVRAVWVNGALVHEVKNDGRRERKDSWCQPSPTQKLLSMLSVATAAVAWYMVKRR